MKTEKTPVEVEDEDSDFSSLSPEKIDKAVIFNTDWTTETVALQTANIAIAPRFQRRDAWSIEKKSRFIESLLLGLPIPPIVLAEQPQKGQFLVLDGKQRLLSIWQFWGLQPESPNNNFKLSGLEIRKSLTGKSKADIEATKATTTFSTLRNQPIRTIVIRNWPSDEFLHLVFLRLNTGSTKLSSQELRQALKPGEYTNRVDQLAANSLSIRKLLQNDGPDPRMQDTEILARHLAFVNFFKSYPNRMKKFIDDSYEHNNSNWAKLEPRIIQQVADCEAAIESLISVFGNAESFGRKPGSRLLNKALLDPLLYFFVSKSLQKAAEKHKALVKKAYDKALLDDSMITSISLDTASSASVRFRFLKLGQALTAATGTKIKIPDMKA